MQKLLCSDNRVPPLNRSPILYTFCNPPFYYDLRNTFFNKIGNSNEIHNMSSTEKLPLIFSNNDLIAILYVANFIKKITDDNKVHLVSSTILPSLFFPILYMHILAITVSKLKPTDRRKILV